MAYNRRELLLEAVGALHAQTVPLDRIVVVDNASTDGTSEALASDARGVDVVTLDRNTGGAGGFAVGLAAVLEDPRIDWVWLMDDDTIPTPTALEELVRVARLAPLDTDVLGSRVVWTDGREHPMNTPRPNPFASRARRESAAKRDTMDIRSTSFVSMLVRADAARRTTLPVADYFIWNDDFEYSSRLIRGRRGLAVPASVVVHKTRVLGSTDADPGERFRFEVRNKIWLMRFSRALSVPEKAVYSAATVRRWIRTFRRSSDRATLSAALRLGAREGFAQRPRATDEVLAGLGPVSAVIARHEAAARK